MTFRIVVYEYLMYVYLFFAYLGVVFLSRFDVKYEPWVIGKAFDVLCLCFVLLSCMCP